MAAALIRELRNPDPIHGLYTVLDVLERDEAPLTALVEAGLFDEIARLIDGPNTESLAFVILARTCFHRSEIAPLVAAHEPLMVKLLDCISQPNSRRQEFALRSISNVASSCTTVDHICPIPMQRVVLRIVPMFFQQSLSTRLRGLIVTTLNNLAYNPHNKLFLSDSGVIEVFQNSLLSNDPGLWPTDAAIGIANLLNASHPAHQLIQECGVLPKLVRCLDLTLDGKSYPPNTQDFYTDWRVMMAMSRLCANRNTRTQLRPTLLPLVRKALDRVSSRQHANTNRNRNRNDDDSNNGNSDDDDSNNSDGSVASHDTDFDVDAESAGSDAAEPVGDSNARLLAEKSLVQYALTTLWWLTSP